MKKFLFILFIYAKIIETICAGKDEVGPLEKVNKGKRQMEVHSDSDQNSSNSNELPTELISNQIAAGGNLEDIILPNINWLKALKSNYVENVPHSPKAQYQIMHNVHSMQWPKEETSNLPIQLAEQQVTGQHANPKQLISLPYHQPIQLSPGSSMVKANFAADISAADEQWRKAEADLHHHYYQKMQKQHHSADQSNHQIIGTSHEIHQQGDQQIVQPIATRIQRNDNPNLSSHRTLLPIPQFEEHSFSHLLNEIHGLPSDYDIPPSMGSHGLPNGYYIPPSMMGSHGLPSGYDISPSIGSHGIQVDAINQSTTPTRILRPNALNLSNSGIIKIQQAMDNPPAGKNVDKGKNPISTNKDEERPFVCQKCERGFKRKDALVFHQTKNKKPCIKKGSTPFMCPFCEKTYAKKRALQEHMIRKYRKANALKSDNKEWIN